MASFSTGILAGILLAVIAALLLRLRRAGRGRRAPSATVDSFVTSMRAVGELSVFRIMTKEVISASDHWFGEFGKKYLSWLFSTKRMTLIIEFDVDFRYDLTSPAFEIAAVGDGAYRFHLPPCHHDVLIRNMRIHSEDKTEFLPWLMPDLLGRFLTGGFSVDAKNQLIAETRLEALRFAEALVQKATTEAQASATRTLVMLGRGLGAREVSVTFTPSKFEPDIDTSRIEAPLDVPTER